MIACVISGFEGPVYSISISDEKVRIGQESVRASLGRCACQAASGGCSHWRATANQLAATSSC